jgi:hypothetical protein
VRAAQLKSNSDSLNDCAKRQFSLSQNTSYTLPPAPPPLYIFRQHVLFHTELFLDTDLLFNHNQTFKLLSKTSVMAARKQAAIASSSDLNESASALSKFGLGLCVRVCKGEGFWRGREDSLFFGQCFFWSFFFTMSIYIGTKQ